MKRCIINVSIGDMYVAYQNRLKESIRSFHNYDLMFWSDDLPVGSKPHKESLYGFKVHAFKAAFDAGYDSVMWLDSPTVLTTDIDYLFDIIENEPELIVDSGVPLYQYCNEETINHYGYTPQEVKQLGWRLNFGYVFGFTKDSNTFKEMYEAEAKGFFTNAEQDYEDHIHNTGKKLNGEYVEHRHEESIISIIVQKEGRTLKPYSLVMGKLLHEKSPL
jgi:hypothetical protein